MNSRNLFAASRDLFVNIKDFLVIFDPTKRMSINNHYLLLINSPHGEEVWDFWPLAYLLTWLALSSLYLFSCLFGGKNSNNNLLITRSKVSLNSSRFLAQDSEINFVN